MKKKLPDHLRLTKKEKEEIENKLNKIRDWFLLGFLHGTVIILTMILYKILT